MTSMEGVHCACRRKPTDRVPIGFSTGSRSADLIGVSRRRYVTNPQTIADEKLALNCTTSQDIVVSAADTYFLAEGLGREVDRHDDKLHAARGPLFLEDLAAAGIEVPEVVHKMDPAACTQSFRGRVYLNGNIDLGAFMLPRTADATPRESRHCIKHAGQRSGFILGTGRFVPRGTPVENLWSMVGAARVAGSPEGRNL